MRTSHESSSVIHSIKTHDDSTLLQWNTPALIQILVFLNFRVVQNNIQGVRLDSKFVNDLGTALTNSRFYIEAADFYDITGQELKALENYRRSQQFEYALRIAKRKFPGEVVAIEEEWADHLFEHRSMDMACNHYIEAGKLRKALEAAIEGKHWNKALHIIQVTHQNFLTEFHFFIKKSIF